jgi:hypothetical protein
MMDSVTEFVTGYVVPAGAGLAGDPGLKASARSTGGVLSVFETTIEAGPPLHVHDREDECSFVLDGELSVRCGESAFDAAAAASSSCRAGARTGSGPRPGPPGCC